MNNRSHVRHFLSLTISLGLLLQMLVPAWTLAPTASAAPYEAREQTISLTPSALLTQPQALSQPLTVARVQSRYQAGGPVTASGGTGWTGLAGMLLSGTFAFIIVAQVMPLFLAGGCA